MPKNLPTAAELWEGEVSFFSIDTDCIQAAGYNFDSGALHQLPSQLPVAMELLLTEIVVREIIKHQMEPVLKSIDQIKSASKILNRVCLTDVAQLNDDFEALEVEATAREFFRDKISRFAASCRGGILPIEGKTLAEDMFDLYFKVEAPFGFRADKKSEFPDAATVLLLEQYAKEQNTKGIIASHDNGVAAYAATSESIYCVKSIAELTALFAASDEHAEKIKARILGALADDMSVLQESLENAVENHVQKSKWSIGEISTATVSRVEANVYETELSEFKLLVGNAEIWKDTGIAGVWLIELPILAICDVTSEATWYVYDYIDRDEAELTAEPISRTSKIKFKAYIACSGVTETNDPEDWDVSLEIAPGAYHIDIGNVEPDFSHEYFEED